MQYVFCILGFITILLAIFQIYRKRCCMSPTQMTYAGYVKEQKNPFEQNYIGIFKKEEYQYFTVESHPIDWWMAQYEIGKEYEVFEMKVKSESELDEPNIIQKIDGHAVYLKKGIVYSDILLLVIGVLMILSQVIKIINM